MSQPPEYPGRKRLERMATRSAGGAYQGAFEAVGAILIATGLGYGFDQHFETEPVGLLVGAVIGFAAFVVRLLRLGRKIQADLDEQAAEADRLGIDRGIGAATSAVSGTTSDPQESESEGPGEGIGLSDVLEDDDPRAR